MGRSRKTGHTGRGLSVLEQLPVLQQEFVGGKKKSSKTEASHLSEYPVQEEVEERNHKRVAKRNMNSGRRVRARESEKRKKRSKQQLIKKTVVDVVPGQTTSTSSSGAARSDTKQSRHNRHLLQREQEHCQLQHTMLYFDALDQKKLDFA
ncbi:hypothetical protein ABG067_004583 [Albugo candida]